MKKTRVWQCGAAALLAATLFVTQAAAESSFGTHTDEKVLISEQETEEPKGFTAVSVLDSEAATFSSLEGWDWDDHGIHGQAVRFNGAGDYVEFADAEYLSEPVTVMGWVNWSGSASENPAKEFDQQLFTLMYDNDNYCTVTLRHRDVDHEIDGVYMEYKTGGGGVTGKHAEGVKKVPEGIDNAIPKKQWTHVALTLDNKKIQVYINGTLWVEEPLEDACTILDAQKLIIGGYIDANHPRLNGMLDDVSVCHGVLDGKEIAKIAQEYTPATTKTTKAPETSEAADDEAFKDEDQSSALASLQVEPWTWYVVGGIVVLMIIGTIALNVHEANKKKESER